MFIAQFFETNPIEAFSKFHEVIFMVQVDTLTKDKQGHIMYVVEFFIFQDAHDFSLSFQAKYNGNILRPL